MSVSYASVHDFRRDIHNILLLLKFIKRDEKIKDPEIQAMLDLAIEREVEITENLEQLVQRVKNHD